MRMSSDIPRSLRPPADYRPGLASSRPKLYPVASPDSSRDQSRSRLTIGELFPDGDVVGQWVFSLTSLTEDLHVGTQPARQAQESGDLRGMLFWHRHMVTRLYEARRLITAARTIAEVHAFAGTLLHDRQVGRT
jgi:hypothetical protein